MSVVSSETPYCLPADLLGTYVDPSLIAEVLAPAGGPSPSLMGMLDVTSDAGSRLYEWCAAGSGELESACLANGVYQVADLQTLTGNMQALLKQICAGLTLLVAFSARQPSTGKWRDLPAVVKAEEMLDRLHDRVRIFGVFGNIDAGSGNQVTTFVDVHNPRRAVNEMRRWLGRRGERWGGCR